MSKWLVKDKWTEIPDEDDGLPPPNEPKVLQFTPETRDIYAIYAVDDNPSDPGLDRVVGWALIEEKGDTALYPVRMGRIQTEYSHLELVTEPDGFLGYHFGTRKDFWQTWNDLKKQGENPYIRAGRICFERAA
jgi:hypothetical protein